MKKEIFFTCQEPWKGLMVLEHHEKCQNLKEHFSGLKFPRKWGEI